ncbi:hypothetical protein TNCV_687741 [Trichonephila clavipes]|nr:hypothetical protein TNCV_687741 [Trichonephila clavipes]
MCERDSLLSDLHDTGRRRLKLSVNIKEIALQSFEDNLNITAQAVEIPFLCQQCNMSLEIPVDNEMNLVARIVAAVVIVRNMPDVFENVRWPMQRCCESSVRVNCRNFEHLL